MKTPEGVEVGGGEGGRSLRACRTPTCMITEVNRWQRRKENRRKRTHRSVDLDKPADRVSPRREPVRLRPNHDFAPARTGPRTCCTRLPRSQARRPLRITHSGRALHAEIRPPRRPRDERGGIRASLRDRHVPARSGRDDTQILSRDPRRPLRRAPTHRERVLTSRRFSERREGAELVAAFVSPAKAGEPACEGREVLHVSQAARVVGRGENGKEQGGKDVELGGKEGGGQGR